jgi:hypothetical protein
MKASAIVTIRQNTSARLLCAATGGPRRISQSGKEKEKNTSNYGFPFNAMKTIMLHA